MTKRLGFTLIEAMVVVAVVTVLAALLFPVLRGAKAKAKRTVCLNNLRQIGVGIRMYSDDADDAPPSPGVAAAKTNFLSLYSGYKELMKSYVGVHGSSTNARLFACPADTFFPSFVLPEPTTAFYVRRSLHKEAVFDYSSYAFNGGDNVIRIVGKQGVSVSSPGLTGLKLGAIADPSRTLLVVEASALAPWSWHNPQPRDLPRDALTYNDAKNVVAFVDGHVSYIRIYWNEQLFRAKGASFSMSYDPPAGYDYKWSGL